MKAPTHTAETAAHGARGCSRTQAGRASSLPHRPSRTSAFAMRLSLSQTDLDAETGTIAMTKVASRTGGQPHGRLRWVYGFVPLGRWRTGRLEGRREGVAEAGVAEDDDLVIR